MQNTILINCRNFACANNKSGDCLLAKVTLQNDGTNIVSKVICIEAEASPEGHIGSAPLSSSTERSVAKPNIAKKG